MNEMTPQEFCHAFLRQHEHGVLATASPDGKPHAATVTYLVEDDYSICFATRRETQKSKHLEKNPYASFVIGTGPEPMSVQLEGTVEIIQEQEQKNMMEHFLIMRGSYYRIFLKMPGYDFIFYRIKPRWIRLFKIVNGEKEVFASILDIKNES